MYQSRNAKKRSVVGPRCVDGRGVLSYFYSCLPLWCITSGHLRGVVHVLHMLKVCKDCFASATQWTASVHALHMPKPVITFVLKVLRNGLSLDTCCFRLYCWRRFLICMQMMVYSFWFLRCSSNFLLQDNGSLFVVIIFASHVPETK